MAEEAVMATLTGEHFQPVRLHYRVLDQRGLERAFKTLRCLEYDRTQHRWCWLYEHEARRLRFKQSYSKIPEIMRPIVIGSFFLRPGDQLLLDLRTCERAILAIPFFDKHLPRSVAKVTEAEIVNRLFPAGNRIWSADRLFDRQASTFIDPQAALGRLKDRIAGVSDRQEKLEAAMEEMESSLKQPLPEIERFPIHFYEDGIDGFAAMLRSRQTVALQHWLGNAKYTLMDAVRAGLKSK
ncbi:MAG: hypothetical protein ACHRXM_05330 [Isosphaerales bacterium]